MAEVSILGDIAARALAEARAWIGTPYLHQASHRGAGTDCLGLVRGVWRAIHGREPCAVPPYTADWAEPAQDEVLLRAAGLWLFEVPLTAARPGDVLVFRMRAGRIAKHMGLQARVGSDASFVHAMAGHAVLESPLAEAWQARIAGRFRWAADPV